VVKLSSISGRFIFSLALFFILLELTVRIIPDHVFRQPVRLIPDPIRNHIWKPNSELTIDDFVERGIPQYTHSINSLGWIGPEITQQSTGIRLAFLGDSFTEGTVPRSQAMPDLVGRSLAAKLNSPIEIINTGTSSYSPALMYITARYYLMQFKPDILVISIDMTDLFDDYIYSLCAERDTAGDLTACPAGTAESKLLRRTASGVRRTTQLERGLSWLGEYLKSFAILDLVVRQIFDRSKELHDGQPGLFDWCTDPESPNLEPLMSQTARDLTALIKLLKENGTKVFVTAVPHLEQFTGKWSTAPFDFVRYNSEATGAIFIDSFAGIRALLNGTDPQSIYIANDMHFNPKGYQLWADVIAQSMLEVAGRSQ
jgi:lysophospholipase L1-like esterase